MCMRCYDSWTRQGEGVTPSDHTMTAENDKVVVSLEYRQHEQPFWTNGERLAGIVRIHSQRPINLRLIQATLVCEEWVHTGSLEFKEHCRKSKRVWPREQGDTLVIANSATERPFEITIPPQKRPKKYPPSFSLRYNSITWRVKSVAVYSPVGSEEVLTAEAEEPFQMCTRDEQDEGETSHVAPLALDEYSYTIVTKDFLPVRLEPRADGSTRLLSLDGDNVKDGIPDGSLQVTLMIPQSGLVQAEGQSTPIYMQFTVVGIEELQVAELDLSLIESADTYYKDPIISTRKLKTLKNITLKGSGNKLDTTIEASSLAGLSEDFKTEWQSITHIFKMLFLCRSSSTGLYGSLKWEVPVRVLSPAESVRYAD